MCYTNIAELQCIEILSFKWLDFHIHWTHLYTNIFKSTDLNKSRYFRFLIICTWQLVMIQNVAYAFHGPESFLNTLMENLYFSGQQK